jgi:PTH1 family peptidyl-tRNA hydrolase
MCYDLDMQFCVGLGNPGQEYVKTRHNAGFLFVEQLAEKLGATGPQDNTRFEGKVWRAGEVFLLEPQTYMNESGRSVRKAIEYYDKTAFGGAKDALSLKHLFIAFDDLDLEVGSYKLQFGRGPKVHNGLNSVYQHLGTDQFWHVRIGVDGRKGDRTIPPDKYVLSGFTGEERPQFQETLFAATQAVLTQLSQVE